MDRNCSEDTGPVFRDIALRAFAFLESRCGFRQPHVRYQWLGRSSDITKVRYESDTLFLTISYAHMEAELTVTLGPLRDVHDFNEYGNGFSLPEALSMLGSDLRIPPKWTNPRSVDQITVAVTAVAEIVRTNLLDIVRRPDIETFLQWQQLRQLALEEQWAEDKVESQRQKADMAWQEKDYERAVVIYESIQGHLTPVDSRKLEIARKRIAGW